MLVEIHFVRGLAGKVDRFSTHEPHEPHESLTLRAVAEFPGFFDTIRVDDQGADSTILSIKCGGYELLARPLPAVLFGGVRPFLLTRWCRQGESVEVEFVRDCLPARWSNPPEA